MKKTLAIGEEGFLEMIRGNRYYVDKTAYIKSPMESGSCVPTAGETAYGQSGRRSNSEKTLC